MKSKASKVTASWVYFTWTVARLVYT